MPDAPAPVTRVKVALFGAGARGRQCLAALRDDARLAPGEREARASALEARAVTLLRQAHAARHFNTAYAIGELRADPVFARLSPRGEFQKLLSEAERALKAEAK